MAKKRQNNGVGGLADIFIGAAAVAGGAIIANLVASNSFVQSNRLLKSAIPIAGAVAVPMLLGKGKLASGVSTGMATYGILTIANEVAPGFGPALAGGSSQWKTNFNPGVAAGPENGAQVIL